MQIFHLDMNRIMIAGFRQKYEFGQLKFNQKEI